MNHKYYVIRPTAACEEILTKQPKEIRSLVDVRVAYTFRNLGFSEIPDHYPEYLKIVFLANLFRVSRQWRPDSKVYNKVLLERFLDTIFESNANPILDQFNLWWTIEPITKTWWFMEVMHNAKAESIRHIVFPQSQKWQAIQEVWADSRPRNESIQLNDGQEYPVRGRPDGIPVIAFVTIFHPGIELQHQNVRERWGILTLGRPQEYGAILPEELRMVFLERLITHRSKDVIPDRVFEIVFSDKQTNSLDEVDKWWDVQTVTNIVKFDGTLGGVRSYDLERIGKTGNEEIDVWLRDQIDSKKNYESNKR